MGKRMPGYPCCPYIVKKIQTEQELWYYIKVFVSASIERDMDAENIVSDLIATLTNLSLDKGLTRPDLSTLGKTAMEICDAAVLNPQVPPYHNCTTLYKKIDTTLAGCRLCPYSKDYQNANETTELSLFRFMLESESNFSYVTQLFDVEYFKSCIDVSMGIPVFKAHFFPMLKILLTSMLKPNIRLLLFTPLDTSFIGEEQTPFDLAWEDAFQTFPSRRKVAADLKKNPMWKVALKSSVKEMIDSAAIITKEDVRRIFEATMQEKAVDKDSSVSAVQIEQPSILEVPTLSSPVVVNLNQGMEQAPGVSLDAVSSTAEILGADSDTNSPVTSKADVAPVQNPSAENTSALENSSSVTPVSVSEESEDSVDVAFFFNDDLIVKGHLTKDLLDTKKILLLKREEELPKSFYHGTLRDLTISIEVVTDIDGDYAYLIWSRHLGKFICCKIADTCEELKSLLTRAKIKKICHTPYLLYSVSKLNNIRLKNVFSIHTAHNCLMGSTYTLPYKDLVKSYSTIKPYGYVIDETITDGICVFLSGMPLYRPINKVLTDRLDESKKPHELLGRFAVDEALGVSYLYRINFDVEGASFALSRRNEIVFNNKFLTKCKCSGRKISYYASEGNESCMKLFIYILRNLSEKGIFRNKNVQIIGMSDSVLEFFMDSKVEDYICSVIELLVFSFGKTYTSTGVHIGCTKVSL